MSNKHPVFEDFEKSIKRLDEVLKLKETKIIRDSAIKRFELCFDLAWKSSKAYAKSKGVECYSPKDCFKEAFQLKLIDYDEQWLNMVDDRNLTIHLYEEKQADKVYSKLLGYLKMFRKLLSKLKEK